MTNTTLRSPHSKSVDEDAWIGQIVDCYRLARRIGCGAMGVVYEAVHVNLGRRYALKLLHSHLHGNQQAVARFVAEGQTANRPAIPGVVAIHDVKRSKDGLTYILMEYLDGETLAARIEREFGRAESPQWNSLGMEQSPAPHSSYVNVSLMLARQIASTMEVIHKSGVVHRDLKPENIETVEKLTASSLASVQSTGERRVTGERKQKTTAQRTQDRSFPDEAVVRFHLGRLLGNARSFVHHFL